MYLEYHYVIAVILLSALIAGLLVRWRYKKQITQYSGVVSHLRGEINTVEKLSQKRSDGIEDNERTIESLNATLNEQRADLQAAVDNSGEKRTRINKLEKELKAAITECDGVRVSLLDARNASEKIRKLSDAKIVEINNELFESNRANNDRERGLGILNREIAKIQREKKDLQKIYDAILSHNGELEALTGKLQDEISGLHFQIAAFKGKPVAIEKMNAVVRKIAMGQHKGKFTVKLVGLDGKTKWEYYHHTVLLTETAAQAAADRLNRTEVVIEE